MQVQQAPPKPVVDPVIELNQKFEDAMTAGRLLTPADQSAKRYAEQMIAKHPNHDLTRAARDRLSQEFLARSSQSLEAHDTDAAGIWIDEADHLGADPSAVRTARTQLVEFVLREPAYRRRMMAEIDPAYWVAPRLRSGLSFKEPMQGAHIKTMGVIKPWAPPRSYGLVIRLGADGSTRA